MATTATATKEKNPIAILRDQFESRSGELSRVLPKHIPVERFQRVVLTAVQMTPDLVACNRQSLWNACLKAAQDGLLPDGREGAIVPFGNQAQWMPMIGGLLKRFRNSGQFKSISADVVREGEEFTYWKDENGEHLRHVPGDGAGNITKTYAIAHTKDDGVMIRVMNAADIDKRRKTSRAANSPMWKDWYEEAAMKTVLRNLAKRLPMSSDLDDLVRRDDELYSFETPSTPSNPMKISDVHSALDSFSGSSNSSNPKSTSEPDPQSNPATPSEPNDTSNTMATSEGESEAFDRGIEAKKQGMARKAVPPEYRDADKTHLARAWWQGWDMSG